MAVSSIFRIYKVLLLCSRLPKTSSFFASSGTMPLFDPVHYIETFVDDGVGDTDSRACRCTCRGPKSLRISRHADLDKRDSVIVQDRNVNKRAEYGTRYEEQGTS